MALVEGLVDTAEEARRGPSFRYNYSNTLTVNGLQNHPFKLFQ